MQGAFLMELITLSPRLPIRNTENQVKVTFNVQVLTTIIFAQCQVNVKKCYHLERYYLGQLQLQNCLHKLHFLPCSLPGKYIIFKYRENTLKQSVSFSSHQEKTSFNWKVFILLERKQDKQETENMNDQLTEFFTFS